MSLADWPQFEALREPRAHSAPPSIAFFSRLVAEVRELVYQPHDAMLQRYAAGHAIENHVLDPQLSTTNA